MFRRRGGLPARGGFPVSCASGVYVVFIVSLWFIAGF